MPYRLHKHRLSHLIVISSILTGVLISCFDEQETTASDATTATLIFPDHNKSDLDIGFLSLSDKVDHADWLIYQTTKQVPLQYVGRQAVKINLIYLAKRYEESGRMIANRTVQIIKMLKDSGVHVDLQEFMDGIGQIPLEGSMTIYSSYCQHYFNLRILGLSHENTIQYMISKRLEVNAR